MKSAYLVIIPLFMLAGCAPALVGPGSEPAKTAPRIVDGRDGKTWNDPGLFGPVPPSLQQVGDEHCRDGGFERADGYHPQALDYNGVPYSGGGFYCVGKADSSS
ncbi:MAG: hypothetical protein KFB96_07035 [Thiocapsa sp.]|uniref:hypothetical protein n=1 Tax=Thiocapsa sp. TaxID=2024551 RepID=UPI001BCF3B65|nr:hypothetical protein [Thiocapsa sp.]QVL50202.1 MAG: hypothetical protein KFB96_07035 [Thiocapsa sp.]